MSKRKRGNDDHVVEKEIREVSPKKKKQKTSIVFKDKIIEVLQSEKKLLKQSDIVKKLETLYGDRINVKNVFSSVNINLRSNLGPGGLFVNPRRGVYGLTELKYADEILPKKKRRRRRKKKKSGTKSPEKEIVTEDTLKSGSVCICGSSIVKHVGGIEKSRQEIDPLKVQPPPPPASANVVATEIQQNEEKMSPKNNNNGK